MERSGKKSNIFRMEFEFVAVALILILFQLGYLFLNYANASDGIAVDREGNIYVTDNIVHKYANNGSLIARWYDRNVVEYGHGNFIEPTDIAVDEHGNVYILDIVKGVQKFNSNGTLLARWGGDYSTDDSTQKGQHSIAVDKEGNVYVIGPTNTIQKFSSNGTLLTKWGKHITNLDKINNNEFFLASGLAVDKQGNVYVGDIGLFRIQKFTNNGTFITSWKTHTDNINEASLQAIAQTMDLAVDKEGNVFATDTGSNFGYQDQAHASIQKFSNNGTLIPAFTEYNKNNSGIFPTGIDIDEKDNVYVSSYGDFEAAKFNNNGTFLAGLRDIFKNFDQR